MLDLRPANESQGAGCSSNSGSTGGNRRRLIFLLAYGCTSEFLRVHRSCEQDGRERKGPRRRSTQIVHDVILRVRRDQVRIQSPPGIRSPPSRSRAPRCEPQGGLPPPAKVTSACIPTGSKRSATAIFFEKAAKIHTPSTKPPPQGTNGEGAANG